MMEDYEARKAEIEELKNILKMREAMIAKSKNLKNGDSMISVSSAEAGDLENAKHSFLSKYKVEKWARNYNALKQGQNQLKENIKIGMNRFCPKDKNHQKYV